MGPRRERATVEAVAAALVSRKVSRRNSFRRFCEGTFCRGAVHFSPDWRCPRIDFEAASEENDERCSGAGRWVDLGGSAASQSSPFWPGVFGSPDIPDVHGRAVVRWITR